MFTISVNGSYPRDPAPPRPQILKSALTDYAAGRIADKELRRATERAMVETIGEMIAAGVEVVSDGGIYWEDPVRGLLENFSGLKFEPDSSPRVADQVKWIKPILVENHRFLAERSPVDIRPCLTGPFTLARKCHPIAYDGNMKALTRDLARALNRELIGLEAAGAAFIAIEEPTLVEHKHEIGSFVEAAELLLDGVNTSIMLVTSGGDLFGIEEDIDKLSFAGIGLDMVNGADNDLLMEKKVFKSDKILQIGLIDATSNTVEDVETILDKILTLSAHHDPGLIWVSPNTGMGGLERDAAFEKLEVLHHAVILARRELARRESPGSDIRL